MIDSVAMKFSPSLKNEKRFYHTKQITSQQINKISILNSDTNKQESIKAPGATSVPAFKGYFVQGLPSEVVQSKEGIWYKFQEGMSNAVRRPLKIRDIIENID